MAPAPLPPSISAPAVPVRRLPEWLNRPRPAVSGRVATLVRDLRLNTVCDEARCPNRGECWNSDTATFMILGSVCTRACRFCATATGKPQAPDPGEPGRIAEAAAKLGLSHVVVTSVTRDDLPDGGAAVFAATIRAIRDRVAGATVEVLIPDFGGDDRALARVLEAGPAVFVHNIECVRRLAPLVRPQASHERSLGAISRARAIAPATPRKSGLMLGLGETDAEVGEALAEMRQAGVDIVTLGQYLRPAPGCLDVDRFVPPGDFDRWRDRALGMGFGHAVSSPFTRSSHRAAEVFRALKGGAQ